MSDIGDEREVTIRVNGEAHQARIAPDLPLVDFLNDRLGLTGTKFCCGIGVCRACTVAVRPVPTAPPVPTLSCSTPAVAVDGQEVTTVEGLGSADRLSALQAAFLENFAFQCGYCTPGFLMAATVLIEQLIDSPVVEDELDRVIAEACGAHICRCTGYVRYYQAIKRTILETPGTVRPREDS